MVGNFHDAADVAIGGQGERWNFNDAVNFRFPPVLRPIENVLEQRFGLVPKAPFGRLANESDFLSQRDYRSRHIEAASIVDFYRQPNVLLGDVAGEWNRSAQNQRPSFARQATKRCDGLVLQRHHQVEAEAQVLESDYFK